MSNSGVEIKELLQEQKEVLETMLDITSRKTFNGLEDEVDEFTSYLELRQPYVDRFVELKEKLELAFTKYSNIDNQINDSISQLKLDVSDINNRIHVLDTANNKKMGQLFDSLSKEMKIINDAKRGKNMYQSYQNQSQSVYIDSKQ